MKLTLSVLKDGETHSVETEINSLEELEWDDVSLRILKPLLAVLLDTLKQNEAR